MVLLLMMLVNGDGDMLLMCLEEDHGEDEASKCILRLEGEL